MTSTAPIRAEFCPLSPSYLADPYPEMASARDDGPVFYAPDIDMWIVTRIADVEAIFMDPYTYSASIAQEPLAPVSPEAVAVLAGRFTPLRTMSNSDPEPHARIRARTQKGFSNRRMALMAEVVRERTVALVDAFLASGSTGDLVEGVAFPLPAITIFRLIGFPEADTEMLKEWCGDRLAFTWGRPTPSEQAAIAEKMVRYWQYCERFVATRLAEPADDYTSDLLAEHRRDPDGITPAEITSVIYGLSFAGHETTTNLISNTMRNLLDDPARWASVVADVGLAAAAVEETLRFDTSVITWRRLVTKDVLIGGTPVPAGARLLLLLAGANRDPARFVEPEVFDISRTNSRQHVSFGKGIHFCLGATLARIEARSVVEELAQRAPGLVLVPDQKLDFHANVTFRGPKRLYVTW